MSRTLLGPQLFISELIFLAMKNLLVQLKSGFSRQSSTSEPLTDEDRRKRDEETQRQISQLAIGRIFYTLFSRI